MQHDIKLIGMQPVEDVFKDIGLLSDIEIQELKAISQIKKRVKKQKKVEEDESKELVK